MPNASTPIEREFTLHSYRIHLAEMPRDLLEMQFLQLLENYLALRDIWNTGREGLG